MSIIALLACPEWLLSSGRAPGFRHFLHLFRDETTAYVRSLIGQVKPRCVVVGMLYYLDETPGGSWAEFVLQKLGCAAPALEHSQHDSAMHAGAKHLCR